MKQPIRILHIVSELNQGGIENFIMNVYRKIDREKIQFDFIVHHKKIGFFEEEIKQLGGKVFHFKILDDKRILNYIIKLNLFFKNHPEYKIVHSHLASLGFIYLKIAKKNGVKVRIAHSHGTCVPKSLKGFVKGILFKFYSNDANVRFACSKKAGEFLFKKKVFTFIPNAIDYNKFKFNLKQRHIKRNELGLKNEFLIGHVGRFTVEKNHEFILRMFKKLLTYNSNFKLLLIGDGILRAKMEKLALNIGIKNNVIFAGVKNDIEKYYQAMDLFILPSLFEGLPVTGIEAQVSGLTSIFSDNVTKEVAISKQIYFLGLHDENEWIDKILDIYNNKSTFKRDLSLNQEFNIKNLISTLERFYINNYKK